MKKHSFQGALWLTKADGDFNHDGVTGLATFDPKYGIKLEIPFGSILGSEVAMIQNTVRNLSRVYGLTWENEYITLVNCGGRSHQIHLPGSMKEAWRASEAVVSRDGFCEPDALIESAHVYLGGLFEWCGQSVISHKESYSHNGQWVGDEIRSSMDMLDEVIIYTNPSVEVSLRPIVTVGAGRPPFKMHSLSEDFDLHFHFIGDLPKLHDAIFETIIPFRDLLALLMGFRAEITKIELWPPENKHPVNFYASFVEVSAEDLSPDAFQRMPFPYQDIASSFQNLADNWFSLANDAKRAAEFFLGVLAEQSNLFLTSEFVAAAGALEALSRVGHSLEELPEEEFKRRIKALKENIDEEKVRKWALYKLEHSNFTAADALLTNMLNELQPYTEHVIPNTESFKRDHRISRNAYIHQSEAMGTESVLSGEGLLVHTRAVYCLIYGKLMDLLGICPERMVEQLKKSNFKAGYLQKARSMYKRQTLNDLHA